MAARRPLPEKGAAVTGPNGKTFTAASTVGAIATRAIMADLRAGAGVTGGPAGRHRSPRRTGRVFCRRWMRRWRGRASKLDGFAAEACIDPNQFSSLVTACDILDSFLQAFPYAYWSSLGPQLLRLV